MSPGDQFRMSFDTRYPDAAPSRGITPSCRPRGFRMSYDTFFVAGACGKLQRQRQRPTRWGCARRPAWISQERRADRPNGGYAVDQRVSSILPGSPVATERSARSPSGTSGRRRRLQADRPPARGAGQVRCPTTGNEYRTAPRAGSGVIARYKRAPAAAGAGRRRRHVAMARCPSSPLGWCSLDLSVLRRQASQRPAQRCRPPQNQACPAPSARRGLVADGVPAHRLARSPSLAWCCWTRRPVTGPYTGLELRAGSRGPSWCPTCPSPTSAWPCRFSLIFPRCFHPSLF